MLHLPQQLGELLLLQCEAIATSFGQVKLPMSAIQHSAMDDGGEQAANLQRELVLARKQIKALQLEVADLRYADEEYEASVYGVPEPEQPFRFMDLPKDIRLIIYGICLVVEEVHFGLDGDSEYGDERFFKYFDGRKGIIPFPPTPSTQLFDVSQQVRTEALDVYLSSNLFMLTGTSQFLPHVFWDEPPHKFTANGLIDNSIRNLSISFDFRAMIISIITLQRRRRVNIGEEEPIDTWRQQMHEISTERLLNSPWTGLIFQVQRLSLKFLQVNFENCFCHCACERLVEPVMDWLVQWKKGGPLPDVLDFVGTKSDVERQMITDKVSVAAEKLGGAHEIRFSDGGRDSCSDLRWRFKPGSSC